MRYEVVFSGAGGQGMILSGKILAEAAAIEDKKYSTQTQSYGPESRGGMTEAYVIISNDPIDYPEITTANLVVAMSQSGLERQIKHIDDNTIVLVDDNYVDASDYDIKNLHKVSFGKISRDIMDSEISANIVSLGYITAVTEKVSKKGMLKTVKKSVPSGTEDLNEKAFNKGFDLGK